MVLSKFAEPEIGANTDPGKFKKLAHRVEETLKQCLYEQPKQIPPPLILVAPLNRLGAPPNQQHLHKGILSSFKNKGFDKRRAAVGICILYTSEEGKRKLHEHNLRFSKGQQLLPPVPEGAMYGSLACSHYNLALRCIGSNTSSPIGNLQELLESDPALKEVVQDGHRWWVLPESILDEAQVDISLWRNQDQNENQQAHEIEILGYIRAVAEDLSKKSRKISQGDLVAAVARKNPAKVSPHTLTTLTKYYIGHLENETVYLVNELVDWHSANVDPGTLVVNPAFYQALVSEQELSKCPQFRHYCLQTQYTTEKVRQGANGPSSSNFLEVTQLAGLCKKPDQLKTVENLIRDLKSKLVPILEQLMGPAEARLEISVYMDLIIRCLFNKPWPTTLEHPVKLQVGKFSLEKCKDLGVQWAKLVDLKHPDKNFASLAGLQDTEQKVSEEDQKELNLDSLRILKRTASDGPEPDLECHFKRGDEVTVIRKVTWRLPMKGNDDYRKDLPVGTEGVVEGFADLEKRQVLLKVVLSLPGGKRTEVTKEIFPRNLKLTSEFKLEKAGASASAGSSGEPAAGASSSSGRAPDQCPAWALGTSDHADVKKVNQWHKNLVAEADKLTTTTNLKARIMVAMEALGETLPKFTSDDLVVLHRKNDKGVPKAEVWTNRAFEPFELLLAPFSTQIKDTHLTAASHALLGLPKHGRGAHPEQQTLALDGRGRNLMAKKGTLDEQDHTGSLFWLVTRTSVAAAENLSLEPVAWEHKVALTLPAKKKLKVTSEWDSSELPSIPLLVNKKALKAHQQLFVYQKEADKKK